MPDLKLDLSSHTNRFAPGNLELSILKKVNFIFGKNGTGKTTIADELASQFADSYSVRVFKDFDGVAVNERLDAVALGVENAEIQKQVDAIDNDIAIILKDIDKQEDGTQNLFTKSELAKKNYTDQANKIERFYTSSASYIKNQNSPQIATTSYDKNKIKDEINKAKQLTVEEIKAHKDTIKADKKPDIEQVALPVIDLSSYLKSTNEVLKSAVKQPAFIPELSDNPAKQQFAKTGMDIHEHRHGEVCAFCGHEIDESRWEALGNYFNGEVKALEQRVDAGIAKVQEELNELDKFKNIDTNAYYGKYADQVKQLNAGIKLRKAEHKNYLLTLEKALSDKKNNLFAKSDLVTLDVPESFNKVQKEYTDLINNNNAFSKDLSNEQAKARDALRYHEIQKKLDTFKYIDENTLLASLRNISDDAQKVLKDRRNELTDKQQKRSDLISKTKDEEKIAVKISGLLKNMGVSSFELVLVTDSDEDQKGQYQIKGHNGKIRPVTALSRGEKNIIAFLYFMFDLESASDNRPRIVVLDDPMTSNDDTMQYIMIGEIQKYYRGIREGDYFVLLTHNMHFYFNVRPDEKAMFKEKDKDGNDIEVSRYKKYGHYRLMSNGKLTSILEISKGKSDFKTSYESLWKELVFLYESDVPDLMLNPCRKICETYTHFMKVDTTLFYGENKNAKKLFDVNQHSIDDLEAEQNAKTKDEIKTILFELFKSNNAEEHFNSYWKGNI